MKPRSNTWRTVFEDDSYIASVPAVDELEKIGPHFVGAVKTATKKYPMYFLNYNYLRKRGDFKKLVIIDEDDDSVCSVV